MVSLAALPVTRAELRVTTADGVHVAIREVRPPEDVQAFAHDAVHARSVRAVEIPGGTHLLHLERASAGRAQLLELLGEALR